jgi:hypothetical protein
MELLGDMGHVESSFGLCGDSVSVSARQVHDLRRTYHRLRNHFRLTRWYSLVTRLKYMCVSVCFGIVPILMQDRYTVCAKRATGLEIILDAPDGTPR